MCCLRPETLETAAAYYRTSASPGFSPRLTCLVSGLLILSSPLTLVFLAVGILKGKASDFVAYAVI